MKNLSKIKKSVKMEKLYFENLVKLDSATSDNIDYLITINQEHEKVLKLVFSYSDADLAALHGECKVIIEAAKKQQ